MHRRPPHRDRPADWTGCVSIATCTCREIPLAVPERRTLRLLSPASIAQLHHVSGKAVLKYSAPSMSSVAIAASAGALYALQRKRDGRRNRLEPWQWPTTKSSDETAEEAATDASTAISNQSHLTRREP